MRLLIVNLGRDLRLALGARAAARPAGRAALGTVWSSEDPRYGGGGIAPVDTDEGLRLPGHAAIVLARSRDGDA